MVATVSVHKPTFKIVEHAAIDAAQDRPVREELVCVEMAFKPARVSASIHKQATTTVAVVEALATPVQSANKVHVRLATRSAPTVVST